MKAIETITTACPDCHKMHSVDRRTMGSHLWNSCPKCAERLARDNRLVLCRRGIHLSLSECNGRCECKRNS